jgi:hypothetical protein
MTHRRSIATLILLVLVLSQGLAACGPVPNPFETEEVSAETNPVPAKAAPGEDDQSVLGGRETLPKAAGPDGSVWAKSGVTPAAYREDLDQCYALSRAQVDHDRRITDDSQAARDFSGQELPTTNFSATVSEYREGNQRARVFQNCMTGKGYTRE